MFLAIALIPFAVLTIYLFFQLKRYYVLSESVKNIPGPRTVPIFGDLDLIRHRFDAFTYFEKQSKKFTFFKTWLGPKLIVVASDVNMIKKIFAAPQLYHRPSMGVLGMPNGLLECGYPMWRVHRRLINPAFKNLQNFLPTLNVNSMELVNNLMPYVNRPDYDLFVEVNKCSLLSIMETTFGHGSGMSEERKNLSVANMQVLVDSVGIRMFNPLLLWDFVFRLTAQGRRDKAARKECFDYVDLLINERRALQTNKPLDPEADSKPQIFIDLLLSAEEKLTDVEIKDECHTMVAAGWETTSLTVCNTVLLLAMHPEIQENVAAEIADYFVRHEAVTADKINQMKLLDMVVKESIRVLPAAPIASRAPFEDCDLGPCILKPGTTVVINVGSMHRDTTIWGADADLFKPERFAPENKASFNQNAYRPFAGGLRNCIGQRYAIMSVKVMLIHLLKTYKFSTKLKLNELKWTFTLTLHLKNKHLVTMEAR